MMTFALTDVAEVDDVTSLSRPFHRSAETVKQTESFFPIFEMVSWSTILVVSVSLSV